MNYGLLAGGWILYFTLHSFLAAEGVKRWAQRTLGNAFRFYRLIYSTLATLGLLALLVFSGSIPSESFFASEGLVRFLSFVLTTFGVIAIQLAFRQYRLKAFLGLAEERNEMKIEGILKYVRHPIYTGLILITAGFFLFIPNLPTLVSCVCILTYLPIGIYLEERKLIGVYGEKYLRYKQDVPALMPGMGSAFEQRAQE